MTLTERRCEALGYRMLRGWVPATGWAPYPFAVVALKEGKPDPAAEVETFSTLWKLLDWLTEQEKPRSI